MQTEFSVGPIHCRIEGQYSYVSYAPNTVLTYSNSKAFMEKVGEILGDQKTLVFIDATIMRAEKGARDYYVSKGGSRNVRATAIMASSPISRTAINFYIKVNKPPYPMKMVATKDEGMKWLKQFETK